MEVSSPFPGPSDPSKGSGEGVKILSPGDTSVFSQGSSSSDEYKSATDRSPSPLNNLHKSTLSSSPSCKDGLRGGESAVTGDGTEKRDSDGEGDAMKRCGSPQNAIKISEFHKSLSDLANTFSTLLISEDEQNVLKSVE